MFWIVMLVIAGLAGLAFGWISLQTTSERVMISFEIAKISSLVRIVGQFAGELMAKPAPPPPSRPSSRPSGLEFQDGDDGESICDVALVESYSSAPRARRDFEQTHRHGNGS